MQCSDFRLQTTLYLLCYPDAVKFFQLTDQSNQYGIQSIMQCSDFRLQTTLYSLCYSDAVKFLRVKTVYKSQ